MLCWAVLAEGEKPGSNLVHFLAPRLRPRATFAAKSRRLLPCEEVEVAALRRLQDGVAIERLVAALRLRRRHGLAEPALDLSVIDEEIDALPGDGEPDAISVAHGRERSADRCFRRDVKHDGAEGCPGHTPVRDPDHVLDPGLGELLRDRQIPGLRHPG